MKDEEASIEVFKAKSAFKNRLRSYVLRNKSHIDPTHFFNDAFVIFKRKIRKSLRELHSIKVHTCFTAIFKRTSFGNTTRTHVDGDAAINSANNQTQAEGSGFQSNQTQDENSDSEYSDSSSDTDPQSEIDIDDDDDDSSETISQSEIDCEDVDETETESHSDEETYPFYLQTKSKEIIVSTNLENWFRNNVVDPIMSHIDQLQENGSGWTLHEIINLTVNINKHVMFSGSSYISLPADIDKNEKSIVNVRNDDSKCFLWSVLASLYPKKRRAHDVNHYKKYENELNVNEIKFPVTLSDIDKFERNNENISINVYVFAEEYNHEKKKSERIVVPVRLSKNVKSHHVHLLMLHENKSKKVDDSDQIGSDNNFFEGLNEKDDSDESDGGESEFF